VKGVLNAEVGKLHRARVIVFKPKAQPAVVSPSLKVTALGGDTSEATNLVFTVVGKQKRVQSITSGRSA
jgi:hypothetical protein